MRKILTSCFIAVSATLAQAEALPSLSCTFTEPFISVFIFSGGVKTLGPEGLLTATDLKLSGTDLEPIVSGKTQTSPFKLVVTNKPGSDGMSDREFPLSGRLSFSSQSSALHGGCIRLPNGTAPRPIKTTTPEKPVGVRKGPGVKTQWVDNLYQHQHFWAYPEKDVKGWIRGASTKFPKGEGGKITVVEGYVKLQFLGLLE